MPSLIADARRTELNALLAAVAAAVTTSVHHVYGAVVYHTPWRYDAVAVGIGTLAILAAALWSSRAAAGASMRRVAWWTFWGLNLSVFVLLLGAFEGLYNHALKDLLYFGGAPLSLLRTLFPAPRYEMPNDWFFELTGVLQVVVSAELAIQLVQLLAHRPRRDATPRLVADRPRRSRLARIAKVTIRVTGPVQLLVGIAFWMGRAVPLRPAHMLVGMVFDLAFVSLVVLAALAGMRRVAVLGGIALAIVIPLFGVVQPRILPGPQHWIVRSAHLLLGVIAMVMAARIGRFLQSVRATRPREEMPSPSGLLHANAERRVVG
jgi:hypothetical protein